MPRKYCSKCGKIIMSEPYTNFCCYCGKFLDINVSDYRTHDERKNVVEKLRLYGSELSQRNTQLTQMKLF